MVNTVIVDTAKIDKLKQIKVVENRPRCMDPMSIELHPLPTDRERQVEMATPTQNPLEFCARFL